MVSATPSTPSWKSGFYARFEQDTGPPELDSTSTGNQHCETYHQVTEADVTRMFKLVKTGKAAGPDGILPRVLKSCSNQLSGVFTDIFNLSLTQCSVPTCFKETVIVPIPKKTPASCLGDYRPVALTPVIMKCFEKLVKTHTCNNIPVNLDPLQFAY